MEKMDTIMRGAEQISKCLAPSVDEVYGISTEIKLMNYEHKQNSVSNTGNVSHTLQHNMFWKLSDGKGSIGNCMSWRKRRQKNRIIKSQ